MTIDKELIERLVRKDHDAYNTFYLQTVDIFYRFVVARYVLGSAEIEDVISDFYVKFWQAVEKYDTQYSFETYMWTIFRNTLKDYFKKQKLGAFPEEFDIQDPDEDGQSLLTAVQNEYLLEEIQEAMKQLDELSYEILFFKFIEEKSYEEIATLLGIAQDVVRQRISRSLKKLKGLLGEDIKNIL